MHIIGRYKIIRELRRGGMATVFRAYDPRFEREVAVKVLPRELLFDSQFRARFDTEAKALASLEHPAIVPVYDFGEQDGQPYLVMRYMPGGSLEDRLKQGNLTLVEAARVLSRLAPALDEAHARGMVHRDLKPANILFDQRSEPYITDFGVVKITGVRMTDTGNRSIGTPAYMSPEQARGEPDIDGRSDIFALGAVLYEMLTGKIPYDAETPAGQLVRRITDPTPNVLELRPDLPTGVQEVIARALAKRRYVRFATASDMATALDAVALGKTPTDTLVIDKTGTPPSGNVPVSRRAGQVRPRLAPKNPPQKRQASLFQRLLVMGTAAIVLAGLLFFGYQIFNLLGIGTGGIPPVETQPFVVPVSASDYSPTPFAPVLGTVIQIEGTAQYQLPEGPPLPLSMNGEVPDLPGVRVWTSSGSVKLRLIEGPVVWLGNDTALIVPAPPEEGDPQALQLERGSLLVKAQSLLVTTNQPEYRVLADFATLGVRYEPALDRFVVDCLEGSCRVGDTNVFALAGGTHGGYERGALLAQEPAQYDYWAGIAREDVPTTTPTPTSTTTSTSTSTSTPEPTATPTATLEPTFTSAPVYVQPTQPVYIPPQPTSAPQPRPTSAPAPTNPPAPPPTNPPAPTNDPNQG